MKSVRFIVSALLSISILQTLACGGWYRVDPRIHYIFYLGGEGQFEQFSGEKLLPEEHFKQENLRFWYNHTKGKVPKPEIENAIYKNNKESRFWKYLHECNDTTALQYWNAVLFVGGDKEAEWRSSRWYHPTKKHEKSFENGFEYKDLSEKTLKECKNKQIRDRYVYQLIKKHFYDLNYEECIRIWRKYGDAIPASELRKRCKSYYAGALYGLDRPGEAAVAFAELGIYNRSLHYNTKVIKQIVEHNANNQSLEFIVQHFVTEYFDSQYEHFQPNRRQAADFNDLAEWVLGTGKSNNPALWRSAQAAIAYIDNDKDRARRLIAEASNLHGTKAVNDNVRMMRLIFNASDNNANDSVYETKLLPDLQWITQKIKSRKSKNYPYAYEDWIEYENKYCSYDLHLIKVLRRTVLLEIVPRFQKLGRPDRALAYLNAYDNILSNVSYNGRSIYDTRFFVYMDTANLETVKQHFSFLKSNGTSTMDKFLIKNSFKDRNLFNELIGTKYLRKEQWNTAVNYLKNVSPGYIKKMRLQPYLKNCNPFSESWITNCRRGEYDFIESPSEKYSKKPSKLQFALTMNQLKKTMNSGENTEVRAEAKYAYALGLLESNYYKSWALTQYARGNAGEMYDLWYVSGSYTRKQAEKLAKETVSSTKNTDLLNKCYVMMYYQIKTKAEKEAEKRIPYPDYSNDNEVYKKNIAKRDRKITEYVNDKVSGVLESWGKSVGKTVSETDVRKTFCDRSQDYKISMDTRWHKSAWYY